MTPEHNRQPRNAETPEDFNEIARATLELLANNPEGILWDRTVSIVQLTTGYEQEAVSSVFMELGDEGAIRRSRSNPRAGVVLTEQGQMLRQKFNQLVILGEQVA